MSALYKMSIIFSQKYLSKICTEFMEHAEIEPFLRRTQLIFLLCFRYWMTAAFDRLTDKKPKKKLWRKLKKIEYITKKASKNL